MVIETTHIYTLVDPTNNQIRYVGKADNPKTRFHAHMNEHPGKPKFNMHKYNWLQKLKSCNTKPALEIIDTVPKTEWAFWEQYWISQVRAWGFDLLNKTIGGEGSIGNKFSDETKRKLSIAAIGHIPWNKGKTGVYSEEVLRRISLAGVRPMSQERRIKMGLFHKGRKRQPETGRKISESKYKPVLQLDKNGALVKEWQATKMASEELGISFRNISLCCHDARKHAGGFGWKFKDVV